MQGIRKCAVVMIVGCVSLLNASPLTIHVLENEMIKMEINDDEYGYDQMWYRTGPDTWISNLYHLSIAFWNGSALYEYNTTTRPLGHLELVEVQEWVVTGSDPYRRAHVILGDHEATPSFTIDLTVSMEGLWTKYVRSDYVISGNLSGAKLYLYGDPSLGGNIAADSTHFDASNHLFYVRDISHNPDYYFGFNQPSHDVTRVPMHYYGHTWSGAYGTQPMRDLMVQGLNYPDTATSTLGDQMAGWNWDLGSFNGSLRFTVYTGLGTSLADLAGQVTPIFVDGFEDGTQSMW